ncbi:MAG: hypothetical protein A3H02_01140 [Candidatus Niyogibacteria bacterium RIFCSPLOWO2_12_FULL_41_13]|uniref:Uncharacterized protein n=1 Tax=Candidatus Niyogibacteria bacterium RIFCSPLOWO2_12_FULL_41_13 TaxID=1801726 RepID=A0A1G2F3T2_9BACT|nr:MAG: hypothetical protein A3H02_01140 [Candidatus Niyogibacteria bacterium RIFCSPLOWO2_12_FULL_41_13]
MKHFKDLFVISALFLPMIAAGQTVFSILTIFQAIFNQIIPILMTLATIVFLYGVISYVTSGADEEKRADAKWYMIWGLIGLFAMVAVWGLVRVLVVTFGVGGQGIPISPGAF